MCTGGLARSEPPNGGYKKSYKTSKFSKKLLKTFLEDFFANSRKLFRQVKASHLELQLPKSTKADLDNVMQGRMFNFFFVKNGKKQLEQVLLGLAKNASLVVTISGK